MAPVSRPVHLIGMGIYAVLYGLVRAAAIFVAVVAFIGIHLPHANYGAAVALLAIASISFIGVGMMTAVLPLISPEKGTQLGLRRAGPDARRLGRLLPGRGAAGVDAVDREDLAGDLRAARLPRLDPATARVCAGTTSGRCS